MTMSDTKNVILMLKSSYVGSFKSMTEDEIKVMVKLWYRWFKDYSVEEVTSAIESYINQDTGGWCPTVGQIKNTMIMERHKDDMSPEVAWDYVIKAIRSGGTYTDRFASLSPEVQKAIGTVDNLQYIGSCDISKQLPFEKNGFMKRFKEVQDRVYKDECLPQVTKNLINKAIKRIE